MKGDYNIYFNAPYLTGNEVVYINQAIQNRHLSGNGYFTHQCQQFFQQQYQIKKALLTTSCSDALEMAAILSDVKEGDEVICPSFTFTSTANAFILRGAKIIFADSREDQPCIDENKIESLITSKTKCIVVVHYAGVSCEMDKIMALANQYNLIVIEDAAQAFDANYKNKPLGSIGHLATFSFHETKNIQCGEGGLLAINEEKFIERAEIIWEKGTNRAAFARGEINKYEWVDIGSSFLLSELNAAFLWAQLEESQLIQETRKKIWESYDSKIKASENFTKPNIPDFATNNGHMYYLVFKDENTRSKYLERLTQHKIRSAFHYVSLHSSKFFLPYHDTRALPNCDLYSTRLLRLPFYCDLKEEEIDEVVRLVNDL